MDKQREFKKMQCCKCSKIVENVGERATKVTCSNCVQKEMEAEYKRQADDIINIESEVKGGNTNMAEDETRKEKYKALEPKILEMAKAGKTASEISKSFDGHPGIPKIQRILAANKTK